jgi:hypothetical protein
MAGSAKLVNQRERERANGLFWILDLRFSVEPLHSKITNPKSRILACGTFSSLIPDGRSCNPQRQAMEDV